MRKSVTVFLLSVCLFMFAASLGFAAEPAKTLPGDITLVQAQKTLDAALVKAREIKVPMNIAVVDAGGNLKAFYRMEDAFLGSIDISIKKAVTARYFNMPTRALGAASQVGQPLYGIEVTNSGLVIFAGGVPLVDKNNVIIGAIGVSGGSVDEDESVAKAGAAALLK
ncbi:MAG: heme-binding protein [Desulfovibrio sp.]